LPAGAAIEQFPNKRLNLHFVQVLKQSLNAIDKKSDHKFFVGAELMGLPTVLIDGPLNNSATLHSANHLLQDKAL
jgi:hypothetical protein